MKKLLFFSLLLSITNSIYSVEPDLYEILGEINKVVSSINENANKTIQSCVDTIMQIPIGVVASNPASFSWNEKKVEKGISHLELLQITSFVEAILCRVAQIENRFFKNLPALSSSVVHNLPQEENGETKESSSTVSPKLLKTMVPLVVVPAFGYYVATTNQTQTEKLVDVIKQHPKKSVAGLGVIIFGGATILGCLGW